MVAIPSITGKRIVLKAKLGLAQSLEVKILVYKSATLSEESARDWDPHVGASPIAFLFDNALSYKQSGMQRINHSK